MKSLWEWFRDQIKQLLDGLFGAKPLDPPNNRELTMNIKWNRIAGQWSHFHGKAKEQWGELTDRDLKEVNGHFEVLTQKIQEKYGIERAEAKQQIDLWTANLNL